MPQPGFHEWLGLLLPLIAAMQAHSIDEGLREGGAELFNSGTGLCGDITNGRAVEHGGTARQTDAVEGLSGDPDAAPPLPSGRSSSSCWASISTRLRLPCRRDSTSRIARRGVLRRRLRRAATARPLFPTPSIPFHRQSSPKPRSGRRSRGLPFSIHVAEQPEEIEFLRTGGGFCREILENQGRWDPGWTPPGKTPVAYLDSLGALDTGTLLVHAVHMTESDWALAARRDCSVVFCPRSNRNLGSGRPRIEKALSLGIRCALGTDSLASNTDLNLFAEAGFTLDDHPSIHPERVIEMITINPARALGRKGDFGSLEPGAKARILAVTIQSGVDESNLAESLIQSGRQGACKWVDDSQS